MRMPNCRGCRLTPRCQKGSSLFLSGSGGLGGETAAQEVADFRRQLAAADVVAGVLGEVEGREERAAAGAQLTGREGEGNAAVEGLLLGLGGSQW